MTSTIDQILKGAPLEDGEIPSWDGKNKTPYRIRLLTPGQLNEIKLQRLAYMAEQGVTEIRPANADIWDDELRLRILARAVLTPDGAEPLADLDDWRETRGRAVDHCIQHYTQLEALDDEIDMQLGEMALDAAAYVKKNEGPGDYAYWRTIDYETLLACFITLVLAQPTSPSTSSSSTSSTP